MIKYEMLDRESDLHWRITLLVTRLESLQVRRADIKEGLQRVMADIEKFKIGRAPETDIEQLEDVLSELLLTHRTISCQIRTLEQHRRNAAKQRHNCLAALGGPRHRA